MMFVCIHAGTLGLVSMLSPYRVMYEYVPVCRCDRKLLGAPAGVSCLKTCSNMFKKSFLNSCTSLACTGRVGGRERGREGRREREGGGGGRDGERG